MNLLARNHATSVFTQKDKELRDLILKRVLKVWDMLPDHRAETVHDFVEAIFPFFEAGLAQVGELTDWYVMTQAQVLGYEVPAKYRLPSSSIARHRATSEAYSDLLRRPAKTVYAELSKGQAYALAVEAGRRRLQSIVTTEMQVAKRNHVRARYREISGLRYYRRVLTGRENCALCAIASTQLYRRGDLLPIHPGCDCGVEMLGRNEEFDTSASSEFLESVHMLVEQDLGEMDRSGRLIDYRKLITTYEHGELGPTLAYRGHKHTIL